MEGLLEITLLILCTMRAIWYLCDKSNTETPLAISSAEGIPVFLAYIDIEVALRVVLAINQSLIPYETLFSDYNSAVFA